MSHERRFLVDPREIGQGRVAIRGGELHHLARVLRLRAGDEVCVFDGRGRGFRARLESVGRAAAVAVIGEPEDPEVEPGSRAVLLQGVPHGERMDWIVEKATEIGAAAIVPVVGERSVVRPRSGGWKRVERWRRIALSAAKQSGRLLVPEIAEPIAFEEAVAWRGLEGIPPADLRRLIFHPGAAAVPPLAGGGAAALAAETAVLVGPEGGWTDDEFAAATAAGWTPAGLGPRILRADTAAAVALALVLIPGRKPHAERGPG